MSTPAKVKPFEFFWPEIDVGDTHSVGACPFCDRPGKFSIINDTGQYRCVACDRKGNIYTFLSDIYRLSDGSTADHEYEPLAEALSVSVQTLMAWGFRKSCISGNWILPGYNAQGKVCNIYKCDAKLRALSTPGCTAHPFGLGAVPRSYDVLWVMEGLKDGLRMYDALGRLRQSRSRVVATKDAGLSLQRSQAVIAMPGSSSLGGDWRHIALSAPRVNFCFDNDHPAKDGSKAGWEGSLKAASKLASEENCPPLHALKWGDDGYDSSLPSGYDWSDLLQETGSAAKALSLLTARLVLLPKEELKSKAKRDRQADDTPTLEPIERVRFSDLEKDWSQRMHFTEGMRKCLICMLATSYSTMLPGEQLFMRVMGQPGTGKTTLAEAMAAAKNHIFSVSIFTGFHSGFSEGGESSSLIDFLHNRTVIIKDGDTLLTAPNRERILSELRDLYDRVTRAHYRNKQSLVRENLNTTVLICGTGTLRQLNRSNLGDRFLDCHIAPPRADQTPYIQRVSQTTYDSIASTINQRKTSAQDAPPDTHLKQVTIGYLYWLKDTPHNAPALPPNFQRRLEAMGELLAHLRAHIEDDDSEVEMGTRLTSQFIKLAVCSAIVLNKESVDTEVMSLCRQVMLDTASPRWVKLLAVLDRKPCSPQQLNAETLVPLTNVRKALRQMETIAMVRRTSIPNRSGIGGRNIHKYQMTNSFQHLWHRVMGRPRRKQ